MDAQRRSPRATARAPHRILADLAGGLTGGIVGIPSNIPIGLVAFAPLGASAAGAGIIAMFVGAALSATVFSALRRTRGLLAGGMMSVALVIAGALASLQAQGVAFASVPGAALAIATVICITVTAGLFELAFAVSGFGSIAPMVPFPVIAGIRNVSALLMALVQARPLLGLSPADAPALAWAHPAALAVSGVTIFMVLWRPVRVMLIPPVFVAMLAGGAAHYAIAALTPGSDLVGPVLGAIPQGLAQIRQIPLAWAALSSLPLGLLFMAIVPAAFSIAALSTLETLSGASTMQDLDGAHGSAKPDLVALGIANIVGGVAGGLPVSGGAGTSLIVWTAGGRTRIAGYVRAATFLAGIVVLPAIVGVLPLAVIAGVVVANAWALLDRESLQLGRRILTTPMRNRAEMLGNVFVSLAVVAVGLRYSMTAAVMTGIGLALLLFVGAMAQSVIRRSYRSPIGRSRTRRAEADTRLLLDHGNEIAVIELQGAIFFGSVDQLSRRVEAALRSGARYVVVDLRHVSRIDLSGARRLIQLAGRLWADGTCLFLASVRPDMPVWGYFEDLGLLSQLRADRIFASLDDAVERAEATLIGAHRAEGASDAETPEAVLEQLGIAPAQMPDLLARMRVCTFQRGDAIIRAGDRSTAVYVLLEGDVDVSVGSGLVAPASGPVTRTRLATMSRGMMFGEMALLSNAPRGADVTARTDVRCLCLEIDAMDTLRAEEPEVAYQLLSAIARQIERNLRVANAALRSFDE